MAGNSADLRLCPACVERASGAFCFDSTALNVSVNEHEEDHCKRAASENHRARPNQAVECERSEGSNVAPRMVRVLSLVSHLVQSRAMTRLDPGVPRLHPSAPRRERRTARVAGGARRGTDRPRTHRDRNVGRSRRPPQEPRWFVVLRAIGLPGRGQGERVCATSDVSLPRSRLDARTRCAAWRASRQLSSSAASAHSSAYTPCTQWRKHGR